MVLQEVDESDKKDGEEEPNESEGIPKAEETPMELSMNSIVGFTRNNTMKVKGKLKGKEVLILIDSGAMDNFISFEAVQCLKIPITTTRAYNVSVGDGYTIKGNQKCLDVDLKVQGLQNRQTFYVFDMGEGLT